MLLKQFEVRKFRNVVDSTPIDVEPDVTCLVGKNEAGKTALLQALYRLRPAYGEKFDVDEQYPRWLLIRDRRDGSVGEAVPISVVFEIEDEDREAVEAVIGPGVLQSSCVALSLRYDGRSIVDCTVDAAQAVRNVLDRAGASEEARDALGECADLAELQERLTTEQQRLASGSDAENAELRERFGAEMARVAQEVQRVVPSARTLWQTVVELLRNRLPTFFYFSEYSMLLGRVDLQQLVPNAGEKPASSGLQTARALFKLAETDTSALGNETYEVRKSELDARPLGVIPVRPLGESRPAARRVRLPPCHFQAEQGTIVRLCLAQALDAERDMGERVERHRLKYSGEKWKVTRRP